MSLFAMFKSAGPTGFGYGSTAEQVTEGLSLGQTILVTGCNSGIGQEACRVLALRNATVLGTARTKENAAAARARFPARRSATAASSQTLRRCERVSQRSRQTVNYLADSNLKTPRADAEDAALATRLWAESEKTLSRSEDEASARMRRRFNALLICSWRETQCRTRR
jgi:NAD(P)-dependent dehydrogenase (short-subunit alcohol dehydrogenase family)